MLDLTNINIVVLLFVLIVSGNFIAELLPCRIQYRMQNDMRLKHFIGLLTISFFVILSLSNYKDISNIKKLGLSFMLYIFFLAFSKVEPRIWLYSFGLLTFIYIINLIKDDVKNDRYILLNHLDKTGNINILEKISKITSIISIIIVIGGVITYYFEKKKEYKKKFTFFKFFVGTTTCKHNKIYRLF
tara:strand:+ start:8798 stop:9358 length:561 start_codon:yes stop_codon:yes gene_type:complete